LGDWHGFFLLGWRSMPTQGWFLGQFLLKMAPSQIPPGYTWLMGNLAPTAALSVARM
jgi:hypothetical protein